MAELTKNDVIDEALDKLEPIRKEGNERRKKLIENAAVIISVAVILLSIILYAFNTGYCEIFNLPPEVMSLDMTRLIPLATRICSLMVFILFYISSLKADKALQKKQFDLLRTMWGAIIVMNLLNSNGMSEVLGKPLFFLISFGIPLLFELIYYLRKTPRKNKKVSDAEHAIVLEDIVRDSIFHTYYIKYGIVFFVLPLVFAPYFGRMNAQANRYYQTFTHEENHYAVIVDYSDKVLAQEVQVNGDVITIDVSDYCYYPKDGMVFTYKKYNKVIIDNGETSAVTNIEETIPKATCTEPVNETVGEYTSEPTATTIDPSETEEIPDA